MPNEWREPIRKHLASLNLAPAREAEIIEELSQHADDRYRELLGDGTSEPDARRLALDELLATELRGIERTNAPESPLSHPEAHFFAGITQDITYAFRTLRKNPRFTLVAIAALALGIGANTAIFSVVNGVLLQPLSYPHPDRVVRIFGTSAEFSKSSVAYPNYIDWRRESHSFSDMGAYRSDDFNFTGSSVPEQISGEYVTASLFPTLGVNPSLGRIFLPSDDTPGAPCTAMLTFGFWQTRFGGSTDILNRILTLNGASCAVIGILPRDFRLNSYAQVYVPIEQWQGVELHMRESQPGLSVAARLKPDVSPQSAQAEMTSIAAALAQQYPVNKGHSARVLGMKDDMVEGVRPTLLLLASAVGFVLIIACANVANLLLARSASRKREFAIRTALGAERWRVIRQLLTESVMLSLTASVVGLLLAYWGTSFVLAAAPGSLPRAAEVGIDPAVLLFTLLIAIVTGILFGLAPAFQGATANPQESLKEGTRGSGGGRHRSEGIFVAVETGLAIVLLAGAGLMIQSVWRLLQVDPGFNIHNVLTMRVALSPKVIASPSAIRLSYQQLLQRVSTVPGVKSAAMTSMVPLGEGDSEISYWPGTGPQPPQDQVLPAMFTIVTSDYFTAMQIPLRHGRSINDHDNISSPPVVVIDEVLAQHLFPNQDPIGRPISLQIVGQVQIVGVVGHAKTWGLDSDDTSKIRDQIYYPLLQVPDKFMSSGFAGISLMVRSEPDPLTLVSGVRAQVAGPTQDQPAYDVRTMEEVVSRSLSERRFTMLVLIIFGVTALLLAAVGIYGVMSYAVTRRVHEIGIRAALGASRGEIIGMVLGQGMRPAALGMLVGLAAALVLTRFMANLLYGIQASDPWTLLAVTGLLGAIALLACYIPARRATAVDPVIALRSE